MPPAALPAAEQCFTIFEGGGAKGITHLGALKALEVVGLARIGTAGTSAGAIIAALTAVGYTADELFLTGANNILARQDRTPIDLLGVEDWRSFAGFRRKGFFVKARATLARIILALIPPVVPLWSFCLARTAGRPKRLALAWRIIDNLGFFSTEAARDILDGLLRAKLDLPHDRPVCFRDIDPTVRSFCCRLKIITTNLARGGLELFDHSTPDVAVADAVAASFSIPLFFKPTSIRSFDADGTETVLPGSYVDGGLVSNLPVWVFFEDKRIVERAAIYRDQHPLPIIAFQLAERAGTSDNATANPLGRFLAYIRHVLQTGVFGGQPIAQNFVTHLTIVTLPTDLGVVQFDCSGDDAETAYASGLAAATAALRKNFRHDPSERRRLLGDLVDEAARLSGTLRTDGHMAPLRACLIRPLGNRSFKVVDSVNMQGDADDDLVLDQNNPGAPTAFNDRDITYVDVTSAKTDLRMTKYERALLRPTLAALIAVPIFDSLARWESETNHRQEPVGVLCLDSDMSLHEEFANVDFIRTLIERSISFAPLI